MEIMSRAVIKMRTLKPLPGEITPAAINNATLPVKIEAARRAIALCTDLPELLRYKSQAEGLAAAVRTIKEVGPEMIRAANELVADAWRKGGELLSQYSNALPTRKGKEGFKGGGCPVEKSPRNKIAISLGVKPAEASQMVRIANAPKETVYEVIKRSRGLSRVAAHLPTLQPIRPGAGKPAKSVAMRLITGGGGAQGLIQAHTCLKQVKMDQFQHLTPDERKAVKAKITEIMELLDEMDRLCR